MTDVDVLPSDTSWLSEPTTGVHQFGGGSGFMGRPDHSQGEMAPSSRRARLIRNFRYVCNVGRFDADFLKKRRSAREPSAERFDKAIVTFCAFGTGCRARLLWECRR